MRWLFLYHSAPTYIQYKTYICTKKTQIMVYRVIGLMSGSSLDGVDIAYVTISSVGNNWEYELAYAETLPYTQEWLSKLQTIHQQPVSEFLQLHTAYGRYLGQLVNDFIQKHALEHKVHFISSHGHTAYHNPKAQTSFQLGCGAAIAATTKLNTIADLRSIDVAFGGQGAPIVPIADTLFFKDYAYCLNIGGIANITIKDATSIKAFDICAANQVLNFFAQKAGFAYDEQGALAAQGVCHDEKISALHSLAYFNQSGAKSLDNDFAASYIIPVLQQLSTEDALHTACKHIAHEIQMAIATQHINHDTEQQLLVTGGGAHNDFLIQCIQEALMPLNIKVVKPSATVIDYKEAIAMALIGTLRWKEETNVLQSVTGASQDSIGGSLWLAQ